MLASRSRRLSYKIRHRILANWGRSMRKVYPSFLIDPGHGGKDPGACGIEAKINLDISLCLKNLISELGLLCELHEA